MITFPAYSKGMHIHECDTCGEGETLCSEDRCLDRVDAPCSNCRRIARRVKANVYGAAMVRTPNRVASHYHVKAQAYINAKPASVIMTIGVYTYSDDQAEALAIGRIRKNYLDPMVLPYDSIQIHGVLLAKYDQRGCDDC